MKKKSSLIFIILTTMLALYAQGSKYLGVRYWYTSEYGFVTVSRDSLVFEDRIEKGILKAGDPFDVFESEKFNYIVLYCDFSDCDFLTLIKKDMNPDFKYSSWQIPYSNSRKKQFETVAVLQGFNVIDATSYITERDKNGKEIKYLPEGHFNVINNPWAVDANSESKIIYMNPAMNRVPGAEYALINDIVFINGFVNPEKMYLYEQNSRAKNIRIMYGNTSFAAVLKDTGNYQIIHLPEPINPNINTVLKVEIIDSYKGTKYTDIVISGILYLNAVAKW